MKGRLWLATTLVALTGCDLEILSVADLSSTGEFVVAGPDTPEVGPGPDGEFGTPDDSVLHGGALGDIDLAVRLGPGPGAELVFPPSGAPVSATAEPLLESEPIPFRIAAIAAADPSQGGLVAPLGLEGVPVVVAAFADLDGDGIVGVTHLDGDVSDDLLEVAELIPVGQHAVVGGGDSAFGELAVSAAGPAFAPLNVVVTAAAFALTGGPLPAGTVSNGPPVFTALPFQPLTSPEDVLDGDPPRPLLPGELPGIEVEPAFHPDPTHPGYGEAFSVPTDGSSFSVDTARVTAGACSHFGLARAPEPATYRALRLRPLRPTVAPDGSRVLYEILHQLVLADDGAGTPSSVRVVPLDRLSNVCDPVVPSFVEIRSTGVRIVAPDLDGDPLREIVSVVNASGVGLSLDDSAAAGDDATLGWILLESSDSLAAVQILLPDPDVDNDGTVSAGDLALITASDRTELGDPGYLPELDLDGSGRIDGDDVAIADGQLGATVPVP